MRPRHANQTDTLGEVWRGMGTSPSSRCNTNNSPIVHDTKGEPKIVLRERTKNSDSLIDCNPVVLEQGGHTKRAIGHREVSNSFAAQ